MGGAFEMDKEKAKAKVEEADRDALLERHSDTNQGGWSCMRCVGAWGLKNTDGPDSSENVSRNVYIVRKKDILSFLGDGDETIHNIRCLSGATIQIYSCPETNVHGLLYLTLNGTDDEVQVAELLIVDAITEKYEKPFVPTALMPENLRYHRMFIPLAKVAPLLESTSNKHLDTSELPSKGEEPVREVIVYGSLSQVFYAMKMFCQFVYQEPGKPEHAWDTLVEEFTSTEETVHQESAMLVDENKQHCSDKGTAHDDSDHIEKEKQPPLKRLRIEYLESKDETRGCDAETENMECDEEADQNALLTRSLEMEIYSSRGQQRLKDTVGQDSKLSRIVFAVRVKDIPRIIGEKYERLNYIRRASGATILLSYDPDDVFRCLARLELWGTGDAVQFAELLIVDAIIEKFEKQFAPTALMPSGLCCLRMFIPSDKVTPLLDSTSNKLMEMEAETGAWIEICTHELPSELDHMVREVMILGSLPQILNAKKMFGQFVNQGERVKRDDVQDALIKAITFTEERESQESAKLEEGNKQRGSDKETARVRDAETESMECDENALALRFLERINNTFHHGCYCVKLWVNGEFNGD